DGERLAYYESDHNMKPEPTPNVRFEIWDISTREILQRIDPALWRGAMAFTPASKALAFGPGRAVEISARERNGSPGGDGCDAELGRWNSLHFSHNGQFLAGFRDGRPEKEVCVDVWSCQTGTLLVSFQPGQDTFGCCLSPDGKRLATLHQDGRLRLWDIPTG